MIYRGQCQIDVNFQNLLRELGGSLLGWGTLGQCPIAPSIGFPMHPK